MNFSMHPSAAKYSEWKFDGERDYLSFDSYIFRNTFRDIALVARELGEGEGVKFEHECYDVGHLYNLKFCIDTGMFKPPVLIQFVLGILGNHGLDIATPTEARAMQGLKGPDRISSDISRSAVRDIAGRTEDSFGGICRNRVTGSAKNDFRQQVFDREWPLAAWGLSPSIARP
ncbi:hypothetical protein EJI01_25885 [Variovorax sp. MHTC-1]|nr:hypothetical protein EJI01_25885 [Variovorax sp. MHTC-1]